jgi:phage-related baseplate assembly protein
MKDGNPSNEILELVSQGLNHERVRPLTDYVQVLTPTRVDFSIDARLTLYINTDSGIVQ